ncbi:hypothetical protein [Dinoroseobacter shibae]|uniref:hypothetical protein n=1 Tax=Dinoroseobacter shibae TaxID=215813 RepID=UPI0005C5E57B|nr:hypothetical protein [Dinoroseobacter shibae]URF48801.1 hypothetical protein M8008_18665 [Dinoroseobacter shibae]URF53113.1 hypothetical protein M8007_18690 [Dinoroseobacter shibae]
MQALPILLVVPGTGSAESCHAPSRPFVPSDSQLVRDYRDVIRQDFEDYISDIQSYFRCLDEERTRAFEEARAVSEDYDRFLQLVGD